MTWRPFWQNSIDWERQYYCIMAGASLHQRPPFRAEHLGSLLRPKELLKTRSNATAQLVPADELKSIEDASIKEIVKLQQDLGYRAISDGEYR